MLYEVADFVFQVLYKRVSDFIFQVLYKVLRKNFIKQIGTHALKGRLILLEDRL